MASWLETHSPRRFDELAMNETIQTNLRKVAVQANPPHLILAGPAGVGKTAAWRLIARQILGPSWRSTTHVLQARDLARSAGAMKTFEDFLRPEGSSSKDTLAGRSSLDSFDSNITTAVAGDVPPAGEENHPLKINPSSKVSRLIIIEDADHLGPTRQPYLRRMMESTSSTSRFIFTARSPSRLIDALRSRSKQVRIPTTSKKIITKRLEEIVEKEDLAPIRGILGDIAHVANGNLRRAVFLLELLARRKNLNDRENLQKVVAATTLVGIQQVLEEAIRGRVHDWRWEKQAGRNKRVLKGALGTLDQVMSEHALEGDDVVHHIHRLLTTGRLLLDESMLCELLNALAECDVKLQTSMHGRVQLEEFLHRVKEISASQTI
ncbi:MAG: AAA family ATPase [Candidatus Poseidoniales archaeon]|jgi:DNA polymerase III delta prime subunit|tara:strand:- start:59 stop:1195 length:1137 start_codon:yes stop_codon:yes gene_type:complete